MKKLLIIVVFFFTMIISALFYYLHSRDIHGVITTSDELNQQNKITHLVYFTGIGCPHCAVVSPVLLKEKIRESNILVIVYEIYEDQENSAVFMQFHDKYKLDLGIPLLMAGKGIGGFFVGDKVILDNLDNMIKKFAGNKLFLKQQEGIFQSIRFKGLLGRPSFWYQDRAVVMSNKNANLYIVKDAEYKIKAFLLNGIIPIDAKPFMDRIVPLSGGNIKFDKAFSYKGYILLAGELS